jgi:hypothetical protein
MSSVLEYIDRNPQEAQRLVGLKYEQLKNLIGVCIATEKFWSVRLL